MTQPSKKLLWDVYFTIRVIHPRSYRVRAATMQEAITLAEKMVVEDFSFPQDIVTARAVVADGSAIRHISSPKGERDE